MCELRLKLGGGYARCDCRSLTHISFLVETNDRAVQPLPRVPGGQRICVTAFAQVVLVLVNDERPPNDGQLPLKQRDFGGGKMECAMFIR